jgi:hypothetical protein
MHDYESLNVLMIINGNVTLIDWLTALYDLQLIYKLTTMLLTNLYNHTCNSIKIIINIHLNKKSTLNYWTSSNKIFYNSNWIIKY